MKKFLIASAYARKVVDCSCSTCIRTRRWYVVMSLRIAEDDNRPCIHLYQ